tara:strand:- start:1666 stop:2139 length:474 start_codon:yes stop_codon:yes gene_type:complete
MLIQFKEYLTFQNIYLWINFGILPFWLMLILMPNSKITQILVNSIILPLIFSATYIYLVYQAIVLDELFFEIFKLYLSLEDLYTLFANENFLVIFWLHFIFINLFLGSWVSRDAVKYNIPKGVVVIPILLIYFSGPLGLLIYWFFRIFYAKKLGFHD